MAKLRRELVLSIEPAPNCLNLAYRGLNDIPREVATGLASVEILDLSHNNISDLRCLNGLIKLTTLNLDSNKLDSHARFPNLPNLRVLWVNRNEITNLSIFVENLSLSCPRHYVISYYPQLGYLDDCVVGQTEREEAERIYGRRRAKSVATSSISQSEVKRRSVSHSGTGLK